MFTQGAADEVSIATCPAIGPNFGGLPCLMLPDRHRKRELGREFCDGPLGRNGEARTPGGDSWQDAP